MVTAVYVMFLSGCSQPKAPSETSQTSQLNAGTGKELTLKISLDDSKTHITYTIENPTDSRFIISTDFYCLVTYKIEKDGNKTPITEDGTRVKWLGCDLGAGVDMTANSAFSFTTALDFWLVGKPEVNDKLQATLEPLAVNHFKESLRKEAKLVSRYFMKKAISSNVLTVGSTD